MSDKMREEFEEFYLTEYDELTLYGNRVLERMETFCGDEIVDSCEYANVEVQFAWGWWVKSRAALCVELPLPVKRAFNEYDLGYNEALDNCEEAIHAAGVKTK